MVKIIKIQRKSLADKFNLNEGDNIISINGNEINDRLDFNFYSVQRPLTIKVVIKGSIEETSIEITSEDEELGIEVEDLKIKHCGNNCLFCFVGQNPKKMRKTLYVKDEDYRYSFLYGNYFTLTNTKQSELERIVKQNFSPLYISVHAVNVEVRRFLLGNMGADNLIPKLEFLINNGIELHTQIVLCPGHNDGNILEETIKKLYSYYPGVGSIAVVPLGKSKHGKNNHLLNSVNKDNALDVISIIQKYQNQYLTQSDTRFVFAADEFFLKAELEIPDDNYYEDYSQYEDGVGMVREYLNRFEKFLPKLPKKIKNKKKFNLGLITGKSFFKILNQFVLPHYNKIKNLQTNILSVDNLFYGEEITVAGLLTGQDIYRTIMDFEVKYNHIFDLIILPDNVLNQDGLFLDDYTLKELEIKLEREIIIFSEFESIFLKIDSMK